MTEEMKLECSNCHNLFVWSREEQELYQKRGLEKPDYCPICRGIINARAKDMARNRYENE